MANNQTKQIDNDTPLRVMIDTQLTETFVNELFQQQNQDGSFPATTQIGDLFNVDFQLIKDDLQAKGLNSSIADEIHRLISTGSILFYFLYYSQKTHFPVDLNAIQEFISNTRTELESFSSKDDPIMQTYIDKGDLAVQYVTQTREKYANICNEIQLKQSTWESYIQHLMGLDKLE